VGRGGRGNEITALLKMSEFEVKFCEEHCASRRLAASDMRLDGIIACSAIFNLDLKGLP
jgi:hypothetical protein